LSGIASKERNAAYIGATIDRCMLTMMKTNQAKPEDALATKLDMPMPPSAEIVVFGTDHSPWAQAVLMALSDRGLPWRLRPFPLSWNTYQRFGLVMPVCRWPDGTITSDSFEIIAEIERRYDHEALCEPPESKDQMRLEKLFLSYVMGRAQSGRRLRFIHAWARKVDRPASLYSSALRALLALYFWILIIFGGQRLKRMGYATFNPESFRAQCQSWQERLAERLYLGGSAPNAADYALCGHLQCMASGLTDETLAIVQEHARLLDWLERMHQRLQGYDRLYSVRLFGSTHQVPRASKANVAVFYATVACCLLAWPITALVIAHALSKRRINRHRTGGLIASRNRSPSEAQ